MSEQNEPVVVDSPVVETTPVTPAVDQVVVQPVVETQSAPVEPKEDVEELKAKNKRYLEQMKGWKQKAEELEAAQITKTLAPEPVAEVPQENVYEEPKSSQPVQRNNILDNLAILNAINYAKSSTEKKHRNDEVAPWSDELEAEVEKEIKKVDPSGTAKINPLAWENAYKIVRGDKASEQLIKERTKKVDEVQKREIAKQVVSATVTTPSKPTETAPQVTYQDVVSGKVQMTCAEMMKRFPDEILKNSLGI